MKMLLAALVALTIAACSLLSETKSQRDLDINSCAYGVIVPDNIQPDQRAQFVRDVTASCMRTKGYSDAEAQP